MANGIRIARRVYTLCQLPWKSNSYIEKNRGQLVEMVNGIFSICISIMVYLCAEIFACLPANFPFHASF